MILFEISTETFSASIIFLPAWDIVPVVRLIILDRPDTLLVVLVTYAFLCPVTWEASVSQEM